MMWFICGLLTVSAVGFANGLSCASVQDRKPIFLIHPLLASGNYMAYLEARIKLRYPCAVVFNSYAFSGLDNLTPLQEQLDGLLGQQFLNFTKTYPGGIDLIGFSQGALLARLLVQRYPQHNVHNLISIAGLHGGQYGAFTLSPTFSELPPVVELLSAIFYTPEAQKTNGVANFWNDPTQPELHLRSNLFLPYYNNEIWTEKSICYREGLLKVKKFIVIFGPDDGIVIPWQSGDFSFYNRCKQVVNITQRQIYKEDRLGLRTLDKEGRFIRYIVPGVQHIFWPFNNSVIDNYILPHLT